MLPFGKDIDFDPDNPDPVNGSPEYPLSWNRYLYCRNDPLNHSDPSGELLETLWDAASFALGLKSMVSNISEGNWGAAALDAGGALLDGAAMLTPLVPNGVGVALKAGRTVDNLDDVGDAARVVKEGIYEFVEEGGQKYVGQSGNIPKRLKQHKASGKLPNDAKVEVTEVLGGKTKREVAEHKRIQELTGGEPARTSQKVSNKKDPIGKRRKHLIEQQDNGGM